MMSSTKKISRQGDMPSLEPEDEFASYSKLMKEATDLYDSAIENDDNEEEKELSELNQSKLELCHAICEQLLANGDLPLEDRITLNYYLSGHQDYPVRVFYLNQALADVEALEIFTAKNGSIKPDPMREILETQLKLAEEKAYGPRTPVGFVDNTQRETHTKSFMPSSQHAPYMLNAYQQSNVSQMQTSAQKQSSYCWQMQGGFQRQGNILNQPAGQTQRRSMQSFDPSSQHIPQVQHNFHKKQHGLQIQNIGHGQLGSQMRHFDPIQNDPLVGQVPRMHSFVTAHDALYVQQVPSMVNGFQDQNGNQMQHGSQSQPRFQMPPLDPMQRISPVQAVAPVQHCPAIQPFTPTLHEFQMQRVSPTRSIHDMQSLTYMQHGTNTQHDVAMLSFSPMEQALQIQRQSPTQSLPQKPPVAQMLPINPVFPRHGIESFGRSSQGSSISQPLTPTLIVTGPSPQDEAREVRRQAVDFLQHATVRRERERGK